MGQKMRSTISYLDVFDEEKSSKNVFFVIYMRIYVLLINTFQFQFQWMLIVISVMSIKKGWIQNWRVELILLLWFPYVNAVHALVVHHKNCAFFGVLNLNDENFKKGIYFCFELFFLWRLEIRCGTLFQWQYSSQRRTSYLILQMFLWRKMVIFSVKGVFFTFSRESEGMLLQKSDDEFLNFCAHFFIHVWFWQDHWKSLAIKWSFNIFETYWCALACSTSMSRRSPSSSLFIFPSPISVFFQMTNFELISSQNIGF